MKRNLFVLKNFTIFQLHHAHVRKDITHTRLSTLFRTASDGKLGGPGNEASASVH